MSFNRAMVSAFGLILLLLGAQRAIEAQQKLSNLDRQRAEDMLERVRDEVKKHYYDSSYHDVDLDARLKAYEQKIQEAPSLGAAFTDIAAYLSALHDSHTFFIPPLRSAVFDYGFRMQMVGDRAFITQLRPGSDAAGKLHIGDEILSLNHFSVNRADFEDLSYYLYSLSPQVGVTFDLNDVSGRRQNIFVKTRIDQRPPYFDPGSDDDADLWLYTRQVESLEHQLRQRWVVEDNVFIWQMPAFSLGNDYVDSMFDKARKCSAIVLDLRGNGGGSVKTLERMLGNVLDSDVELATRVSRKPEKPEMAKTRGNDAFKGKLIVLVDSRSESAAELFARVIQLEKRGTIVGDRTAGVVMESNVYQEQMDVARPVYYAISITAANLIMSDGGSLEGVGVTPDVTVLPTAADLAAGRDPAMAKAAELAGIKLDPAEAGKLFPFEWAPLSAE